MMRVTIADTYTFSHLENDRVQFQVYNKDTLSGLVEFPNITHNKATAWEPYQVGHQGATFSGITKLPSWHTSSCWYPWEPHHEYIAHRFLTRDMGTTKLGLEALRRYYKHDKTTSLQLKQ